MLYHVTKFHAPYPEPVFEFLRREIDRKDVVRDVGRQIGRHRSAMLARGWMMVIVLDGKAGVGKLRSWLATQIATCLGYYWQLPSGAEAILDGTDHRGPAERQLVMEDFRKVSNWEIESAVKLLVKAQGTRAATEQATMRIKEWQKLGHADRAATWMRIADAIQYVSNFDPRMMLGSPTTADEALNLGDEFMCAKRRRVACAIDSNELESHLGRNQLPLAHSGHPSCAIDDGLGRLIGDYKNAVGAAVDLMAQSGIARPTTATAWRQAPMEQSGFLKGEIAYFAHDRGCEVGLLSGTVDFDFGPAGEIDYFDCRRLGRFAQGQLDKYKFSSMRAMISAYEAATASGAIAMV